MKKISIAIALLFAALVDFRHAAHIAAPAKFLDQQFRLDGPTTRRWRIVPDLQKLCLGGCALPSNS